MRCRVGGAAGNDQELIDSFVGSWANFLAGLGQVGNIAAMSVTVETLPETGERAQANLAAIIDPGAPTEALAIMAERIAAATTAATECIRGSRSPSMPPLPPNAKTPCSPPQ
ncbi:hypothetical protein BJF84_27335 [Rhodococcus sp. CUA-806]|nr:hypothetical protein BJF84_27335 [Rhodococcus sp. CUA-806]